MKFIAITKLNWLTTGKYRREPVIINSDFIREIARPLVSGPVKSIITLVGGDFMSVKETPCVIRGLIVRK